MITHDNPALVELAEQAWEDVGRAAGLERMAFELGYRVGALAMLRQMIRAQKRSPAPTVTP